jgi:hypothetical protein
MAAPLAHTNAFAGHIEHRVAFCCAVHAPHCDAGGGASVTSLGIDPAGVGPGAGAWVVVVEVGARVVVVVGVGARVVVVTATAPGIVGFG